MTPNQKPQKKDPTSHSCRIHVSSIPPTLSTAGGCKLYRCLPRKRTQQPRKTTKIEVEPAKLEYATLSLRHNTSPPSKTAPVGSASPFTCEKTHNND